MSKNPLCKTLILIILAIFSPQAGFTSDISINLIPETVLPGDAFLLEVKSDGIPSGEFDGSQFQFFPVSAGVYSAIISVDVETKPGEHRIRLVSEGKSVEHAFTVSKKDFPVTKITLRSDKVFLSPENQARADREEKKLSSLWSEVTEPVWNGKFVPPMNTSISSPFGVQRIMNRKEISRHRGTDYRGSVGQPIKAVNSGVIVLTEEQFYGGNTLMINHGAGIYSIYLHLSEFSVKVGDVVKKNDVIGLVGATGRATGPHLHLSVRIGGRSVNPESLFALPLE